MNNEGSAWLGAGWDGTSEIKMAQRYGMSGENRHVQYCSIQTMKGWVFRNEDEVSRGQIFQDFLDHV